MSTRRAGVEASAGQRSAGAPAVVVDADGRMPLPWTREALHGLIEHERSHALLLHGRLGDGLLPTALTLAQAWLCEALADTAGAQHDAAQPSLGSRATTADDADPAQRVEAARQAAHTGRPCGRCAACHLVYTHAHPDLRVLLPETLALQWHLPAPIDEKRKPSRVIRIDDVRAAIDWVHQTSSRGRGKVLVICPAEALHGASANALLKTLEEPPPGTRIVLGAIEPARLLPTVRSRCQIVPLPQPAHEAALQWLHTHGVDGGSVLLQATSGAPLEAAALAHAGVHASAWSALPRQIARGDAQALAGWPIPLVVQTLLKLCHDAMAASHGHAPRFFPEGSVQPPTAMPRLLAWQQELLRVAAHAEHPWNEGLLIEALVAQGRSAWAERAGATPGGPGARRPADTLSG